MIFLFQRKNHQRKKIMFSSPSSENQARRGTPTNNNYYNYRQNNNFQRATTPPPSASAVSPTPNNHRSLNQHNKPTQISFAGFGNDTKHVPGASGLTIGRKPPTTHDEDQQNKNQAYFGSPAAAADQQNQYQQQQQQQNVSADFYQSPEQQHVGSPEYLQQYHQEDRKLQKCFQSDIKAAQPLFSARQIATRHLNSGFQLFAGTKEDAVLFTDRMLQLPSSTFGAGGGGAASNRATSVGSSTTNNNNNARGISSVRNASVLTNSNMNNRQQSSSVTVVPEVTASPMVIDYHDDVGHGKRTLRAMRLERRQQTKDDARAFVERNGISILGRMQSETAAGTSTEILPGMMTRKNRAASPSSSHTHLSGMGQVEDSPVDGSKFKFSRKVHPEQLHHSNLTRSLLPVRKLMTPSANALASPPRAERSARVGVRYSVDTNRVLCPDMIPETRTSRLRSLRPPEMMGQGMEIKEGAPQWSWTGGLRGGFNEKPTDPFGGEP